MSTRIETHPRRTVAGALATIGCAVLLGLTGCSEEGSTDELQAFYDTLRGRAEAFDYVEGEWRDDYSDANFYGLAFYARVGVELEDPVYLERASEIHDFDLSVLQRATTDLDWTVDHLEEVLYAALGLIEHASATGETDAIATLDTFIDLSNLLVESYDNYLDVSLGEYAADTYGPTSITGGLALLNLQYAKYLDTPRTQDRIDAAVEIVQAIDEQAFDGQRYLFRPGEDKLFLYPNSIMILVLCRLYELTGDRDYLQHAETAFEGVAPLRHERGFYRSPYSAEYMGAKTDEYSTLSSQNYFNLGLLLLYQNTGKELYLERFEEILTFLRLNLYDDMQGRLLHHWIDGHIAQPDDPEYFCSGCNLQFLYVVWYLKSVVGA
jgi:uncharacterized protein YyaL (SSP411 family)